MSGFALPWFAEYFGSGEVPKTFVRAGYFSRDQRFRELFTLCDEGIEEACHDLTLEFPEAFE